MENILQKRTKYNKILSRMKKQFSKEISLFIIIRLYLTNNIFYYILCVFFRFLPLIIMSGDYTPANRMFKSFKQKLNAISCYNLTEKFISSFNIYALICLLLYILFVIRLLCYFFLIKKFSKKTNIDEFISPNKYMVVMDHLLFLFFPYIIEFLSFSYYIYLFPTKFIIKQGNETLCLIIFLLNTILIIAYNINNFIIMICSNKIHSTSEEEIFSKISKETKYISNRHIIYKCPKITLYIYIITKFFVI